MYLNYINYFRGFAILMVVLGHFSYFEKIEVVRKIIYVICTGGTGPFVFISGFLFHHIFYKRGFNYKKFLKNKLKNVLLPYTIIVIPALIYYIFKFSKMSDIYRSNKILYILLVYYSGDALTATWYIPFALLLFIASPIFLKFIELNSKKQILIIICSSIISMIIQRPIHDLTLNIFQAFIYFFPFYTLGIYISKYQEKFYIKLDKNYKSFGILWLTIVYIQIKLNLFSNLYKSMFEIKGIDLMVVQKLLLCLFMLGIFIKLEKSNNKMGGSLKNILCLFAEYSFGIFFIHNYMDLIISKLLLLSNIIPSSLNIIESYLLGIVAIYFSIGIVYIFRKIFGKNSRMIVGS